MRRPSEARAIKYTNAMTRKRIGKFVFKKLGIVLLRRVEQNDGGAW